jgi:hypothetical protein
MAGEDPPSTPSLRVAPWSWMPTFIGMTGKTARSANQSIRSLLGVALPTDE